MTSERTLKKYRKEALLRLEAIRNISKEGMTSELITSEIDQLRILQLTQEMLDLHLIKGGKAND